MNAYVIVFAAFISAPAAGFELPWSAAEPPARVAPPRPVVSEIVADAAAQQRSFPGVVVAGTEVILGFQTLGRLQSRSVDVGDDVAAGELLAQLTPDDLQDNVRAARAGVTNAEVTLKTAKAAQSRAQELASRNVTSRAQLEQAQRALKSASAGLLQAQSELARAEDAEGFAQLRAPFDGVISAVFETAGAVVNAGAPIVTLSDINTREAVIDLPERALMTLNPEAALRVWLESDPSLFTFGKITRIEPLADAATRTRRVHVSLRDSGRFRLGALMRARPGSAGLTVLGVPRQALRDIDGQNASVWVVSRSDNDAHVSARPVTLGADLGASVDITSGLSPGDEVVIRGVHSLIDGQPVGRRVAP